MKYREKLRRYQEGTLDEDTRREVEADIERHEAIGEFLFETSEIPELEEILEERTGGEENGRMGQMPQTPQGDTFVTLVNKSIRRAFLRLGLTTLAAAVVVILLLQFGLPRIVSSFYYDPGRAVEVSGESAGNWTGEDGEDYMVQAENQMTLDMSVYSELYMPCNERGYVDVKDRGYGRYDINIAQTASFTGSFTNVSGEIVRGDLRLYDPNVLQEPAGNCFAWYQGPEDTSMSLEEWLGENEEYNFCAAGKREDALKALQDLDDRELYVGYVSLNRMMDYENFKAFLDGQDDIINPWCAVKTGDSQDGMFRADNMGFNCAFSSASPMVWDTEKYPDLLMYCDYRGLGSDGDSSAYWEEQDEKIQSEEGVAAHFVSMLRYLCDQKEFMKMMGKEGELSQLKSAADYVEENGVIIYGFAAVMNKETMLALSGQDEVYEIYTQKLR